ncbi:MAG TPA: hypothetical protein VF902_00185 [Coriobacteriia bacterium]
MHRDFRRILLVVIGVLVSAAAATVLIRALAGRAGFSVSAVDYPLGWTLPLASAFVIVGVGWLLLSQGSRRGRGSSKAISLPCPTCGRTVMDDWRMCPYCGRVLEPASNQGGRVSRA